MNKRVLKLIAILILIIIVVVIITLVLKNDENTTIAEQSSVYSRVLEKAAKYNETHEKDIELVEEESNLVYTFNGVSEEPKGKNYLTILNYTIGQIIIMEYDEKYTPTLIVTFTIDRDYNMTTVMVFNYATEELNTYEADAKEILEYRTLAQEVVNVSKEAFAGEDVNMFNKTVTELKNMK